MEVKHINYGTGNRVGDMIYINKKLKKYPKLYNSILNHEKKHTGKFSLNNLKIDLNNYDLERVKGDWMKFIFSHPSSWINFLPIIRLGGSWCIDISLSILWALSLILFVFIVLLI